MALSRVRTRVRVRFRVKVSVRTRVRVRKIAARGQIRYDKRLENAIERSRSRSK